MILDTLRLHNFGAYRGLHTLSLSPLGDRPIVLVGALNGSGKTTLLEAMQLALFGKGAPIRGKGGYADYLSRSINRHVALSEGAGVELEFRYWSNGSLRPIHLKRTWRHSGRSLKEGFEVWRNGVLDNVATERWIEFVEEIIPVQISHLFFFDGEKIEGLADPEQSAALLRVGLHSLLGLDLVDHLTRSLTIVERRSKASVLTDTDRSTLETLEREQADLDARREHHTQEMADTNSRIDQCESELRRLEKKFAAAGGELYKKRKELEAEQLDLRQQAATVEQELHELVGKDTPLLLVGDLLEELDEALLTGLGLANEAKFIDLVRNRDNAVLKKVRGLGIQSDGIEALRKYLEKTRPTPSATGERLPIEITPSALFTASEAETLRESLARHLERHERVHAALEACERHLAAVPPEESLKDILQAMESAREQLIALRARKEVIEEQQRRLKSEADRKQGEYRAQFEELAERQLLSKTTQRVIKHSIRVRETLARYRNDIAQSHMERVERLISECFAQLHRKKSIGHCITIHRETYELQIAEEGRHSVGTAELSAGERQLLAISVLWALAQASGRKLPTVIDTPLGRLDSKHRHFLVENYFPRASHQVVLFSTDEEVTRAYYDSLRPFIGREQTIVFDEPARTSRVLDGYFSSEELAA